MVLARQRGHGEEIVTVETGQTVGPGVFSVVFSLEHQHRHVRIEKRDEQEEELEGGNGHLV